MWVKFLTAKLAYGKLASNWLHSQFIKLLIKFLETRATSQSYKSSSGAHWKGYFVSEIFKEDRRKFICETVLQITLISLWNPNFQNTVEEDPK